MTSGILQNLAQTVQATVSHPDPAFRFWMGVGLLCSLSLQNDDHGVWIAIEDGVQDFLETGNPDEMDVPLVRDDTGLVIDILHEQADYAGNVLVELAREIALTDDQETRLVATDAACLTLLQTRGADLSELLEKVSRTRAGSLGIEGLHVPLPYEGRMPEVLDA